MSLENEYFELKAELKAEEEQLAEFESIIIVEDENNAVSIENRIEAKNRGIESCKEQIKEIKELIAEVKGELREFIENGGEVSQVTLDELKDDADESEKDSSENTITDFKVVSNKNENIYVEGYAEINEKDNDVDLYWWNGVDYQLTPFYHHDEAITGKLSDEQNTEIDEFSVDYIDASLFINSCIISSKDENRSFRDENCTVIINDGAKFECEINEDVENFVLKK